MKRVTPGSPHIEATLSKSSSLCPRKINRAVSITGTVIAKLAILCHNESARH
jgi:hypothetical protein